MAGSLDEEIARITPSIVELRRTLHANPELGFHEHATARRVAAMLERASNLRVRTGVAGTGVVATLAADKPGPCVALRADMDALPIEEVSDKPHRSTVSGCMHACGHDGHTACLVGAALVLAQHEDELEGPVKFIFQPAEEFDGGALAMCEAGVLEDPAVQAIFGLHSWTSIEVGEIGVRRGAAMASSDTFEITVSGLGSHAGYPHLSVDPILVAAHIVVALQSIISRSTYPLDAAVLTVARVQAGGALNTIPARATLAGTLRTLAPSARRKAIERLREVAQGTARAFGASAEVSVAEGYPVLVNDDRAVDLLCDTVAEAIGKEQIKLELPPSMAAEDFAYFAQRVPAAYFWLGVRAPGAGSWPVCHDPSFDFSDEAIPLAIRIHCEIARRFARVRR